MGLLSLVKQIWQQQVFVARTAPVTQVNAAPATIFTITGGLVQVIALFIYKNTVVATAMTAIVQINGVPVDAAGAGVTIVGAAGSISVIPLGAVAITTPGLLAEPVPTVLADTGHFGQMIAGPVNGLITCTFAAGPLVAPETISWRCIYRKIDPEALIA